MSITEVRFSGSVPAIYESHLVPLIFQPYADDMAARVAALRPRSVLETAAGTGVVTRALRAVLPAATPIVATDLNPGMIEEARKRATLEGVTWQQADAQALPFDDGRFDVVVCEFGVMFFPDRVQAFREARRVLAPGGHLLFNVWDSLETNPLAGLAQAAVISEFPQDPPRFLERLPYGQADRDMYRRQLRDAGFSADAVFEDIDAVSRSPSARDAAHALCAGTPMRAEIEAKGEGALDRAVAAATRRIETALGPGPVEAPMRAFVVTVART
jgi:SAM-dependent methyltransferase